MGLIYDRKNSEDLIDILRSNIKSARETTDGLKRGSKKLTEAIDDVTLSGEAFKAVKKLFKEYIIPAIDQATDAIKSIDDDLSFYEIRCDIVAGEEYLDEDNLKAQIVILKVKIASTEAQIRFLQALKYISTADAIIDSATYKLRQMAASLRIDLNKTEGRLRNLINFDEQTRQLFTDGVEKMKDAMLKVSKLNGTFVIGAERYLSSDPIIKAMLDAEAEMERFLENSETVEISETPWIPDKIMQLDGDSYGENELSNRINKINDNLDLMTDEELAENGLIRDDIKGLKWNQTKIDMLWKASYVYYEKTGIQIDPRLILAILTQEDTGSFGTVTIY